MNQTSKARERLKFLGCPYLKGLDEQVVHDLLLSESEARLRVFKWLLGRAHPAIQSSLGVLSTMKSDIGIVSKLTQLMSILGVCSPNDYDLVKGSTSLARQVKFLNALTEVMVRSSVIGDANDPFAQYSLTEHTDNSCEFLESLIARENLSDVFKSDITLIPVDVAHVMSIGEESLKSSTIAHSVSGLKRQLHEHKESTVKLQQQLDKLTDQQSYVPLDPSAVDSCSTAVQVSLDTTIQLMDDFIRCYHDDIKPWAKEEVPELSSLGPISKRVHSLLLLVNELLESSSRLKEICCKWEKVTSKRSIVDISDNFHQRVCTEFQDSIK